MLKGKLNFNPYEFRKIVEQICYPSCELDAAYCYGFEPVEECPEKNLIVKYFEPFGTTLTQRRKFIKTLKEVIDKTAEAYEQVIDFKKHDLSSEIINETFETQNKVCFKFDNDENYIELYIGYITVYIMLDTADPFDNKIKIIGTWSSSYENRVENYLQNCAVSS